MSHWWRTYPTPIASHIKVWKSWIGIRKIQKVSEQPICFLTVDTYFCLWILFKDPGLCIVRHPSVNPRGKFSMGLSSAQCTSEFLSLHSVSHGKFVLNAAWIPFQVLCLWISDLKTMGETLVKATKANLPWNMQRLLGFEGSVCFQVLEIKLGCSYVR